MELNRITHVLFNITMKKQLSDPGANLGTEMRKINLIVALGGARLLMNT